MPSLAPGLGGFGGGGGGGFGRGGGGDAGGFGGIRASGTKQGLAYRGSDKGFGVTGGLARRMGSAAGDAAAGDAHEHARKLLWRMGRTLFEAVSDRGSEVEQDAERGSQAASDKGSRAEQDPGPVSQEQLWTRAWGQGTGASTYMPEVPGQGVEYIYYFPELGDKVRRFYSNCHELCATGDTVLATKPEVTCQVRDLLALAELNHNGNPVSSS